MFTALIQLFRVEFLPWPGCPGDPGLKVLVVFMAGVREGVEQVVVATDAAGIFQRRPPCAGQEPRPWGVGRHGEVSGKFEAVDPAVAEVIFIEQGTRFSGEDLAQGPGRLGQVLVRVFHQVQRDPAPGLAHDPVDGAQTNIGIGVREAMQV